MVDEKIESAVEWCCVLGVSKKNHIWAAFFEALKSSSNDIFVMGGDSGISQEVNFCGF